MKVINTNKAPKAIGPYSQAIEANGLVITSGQLPIDPATGEFAPGGIKEQTRQSLTNAKAILEEAGTNAWGKLQNSLDFGWKRCSPTLHKPPANCPMMSGNRCAPRGKSLPNSTPTASIGKASNAWWGSKSTAKNAGSA